MPSRVKRKVPCTRCGVWVEFDSRRLPPFCRSCKDSDPWFYARMRGQVDLEQA